MVRFELKKVFSKSKNRLAIVALALILIVVSMLTINRVNYTTPAGDQESGFAAARELRTERNQWRGPLTPQVFQKIVQQNHEINQSAESQSEDIQEQNKAFAKKQGFLQIADVINSAFSDWRDYNYYAIDGVTADEATTVYQRRISNLENWLATGEEQFTSKEEKYLVNQYRALKTPFHYEYFDGWSALLQNISTFILLLALVVGFLVSGIFSDEHSSKADAIFYSSQYGRDKAVLAKISAGLTIIVSVFTVMIGLYTGIVLFVLGADGAISPIQLDMWRSTFNITFGQAYLLIVVSAFVGTLFASFLAMLVSAVSRSTPTAIIVPFFVLSTFPFLSRIITLPQVSSFFPDQLLDVYVTIKEFDLVEIAGQVFNTVSIIIPFYTVICMIMLPVLYQSYRKAEVK